MILMMVVASALLLTLLPTLVFARSEAMPPAQDTSPELLKNPGFEGHPFKLQCCQPDGLPYDGILVADGWKAWWLQFPPKYIALPDNCPPAKPPDIGCYWARPEFTDAAHTERANRIHGGNNAQEYFTWNRMHEGGLYQQVTGIISGTRLHFSVYISAWMCVDPEACKGGYVSDQPTTMHLKVGIDPTGGTDPFSPNIVWSLEADSFDRWTQYSVEAVAQSDQVTVFTHTRPEWPWAHPNNDVYVDDASLKAVGAPAVAPAAALQSGPTPAVKAASASVQIPVTHPQNNQRPDGSTVHVVQSGDTLFGMALAYGVTVDQIMQLNNLQPGDYLQIGQELIVKGPANPPTPTPAPLPTVALEATAATPAEQAPQPTAVAAALASGGLCVQAFNDHNGGGVYDGAEELIASVQFTVLAGSEQVATYTTTGVNEPYCFENLSPRAYTVRIEPPKGYVPTTDEQIGVALAAGQTANVSFGAQPPSGKGPSNPASAGSSDTTNVFARYRGAIVGLCGVGVLLIAGIVGFVFVSRRK
jgi:LysM repeat protein